MNTRIQVEHTITEMATGIDLVREQILVAQGAPLSFAQDEVVLRGHAIECRVNAEDPTTFLPSPGRVVRYREPAGPGVRVDSALEEGGEVVALYDPMVAKLVVWDRTRDLARARMRRALDEMVVEGVRTLIPLHRLIMEAPEFARGETCAGLVEDVWPQQLAAADEPIAEPVDGLRSRRYVAEVDGRRFEVRVHAPDDPVLVEARQRREARRAGGGAAAGEGAVTSPMQGGGAERRGGGGRPRRGRPGARHRRGDEDGERDHGAARGRGRRASRSRPATRSRRARRSAGSATAERSRPPAADARTDPARRRRRPRSHRRPATGTGGWPASVSSSGVSGGAILADRPVRAALEQLADHVQQPLADRERHQEQHHHDDEAEDPERPQADDGIGEAALAQPRHHAQRVRDQRAQDQQEQAQEPEARVPDAG